MAQEGGDWKQAILDDIKKVLLVIAYGIMCFVPPITYVFPWVGVMLTFCAYAIPLGMGVTLTELFTFYTEDEYLDGDLQPAAPQGTRVIRRRA